MEKKMMKYLIVAAIIIGLLLYFRYDWTRGEGVRSDDDLQTYFMEKWADQTRKEAMDRKQVNQQQFQSDTNKETTK